MREQYVEPQNEPHTLVGSVPLHDAPSAGGTVAPSVTPSKSGENLPSVDSSVLVPSMLVGLQMPCVPFDG
jgi:hypothetical protein